MGLFEKLFGRRPPRPKEAQTFRLLEGYAPAFVSWQGSLYESAMIRAALDVHGRHAAKLQPHVEGAARDGLQSRLKLQPNSFQTWPQFLYRQATLLYARNTAFVVPVIGEYGETSGVFTIAPRHWDLVEDKGIPYIRFDMGSGKRLAVELDRVGIQTRYQYKNELFGEDNNAMKAVLDLISIQNQGITAGVQNSASYRFTAVSANFNTDEDLAKERERFNKFNFSQGGGGVLLFPNTYKEVKQVQNDGYKVDADQMKLIKENVYDYFAVNEDVIQNKAYGDAWLAFYEGSIEWFAINLSEILTRMLYTERERLFGNRVWFTSNRLQYMSNADKLSAISQLADRGLMTRNELREILNLTPLPEPLGSQIPARGEYYNVNEGAKQE